MQRFRLDTIYIVSSVYITFNVYIELKASVKCTVEFSLQLNKLGITMFV